MNEEHVAIEKRIDELFRLIDALSNFDYTPPEVGTEMFSSSLLSWTMIIALLNELVS